MNLILMYDEQIRWGVGDDKFIIQLIEFNAGNSKFRILEKLLCTPGVP